MYTVDMTEGAQLRIGEVARRTGVATELLRAWERRYGLLTPTRTASGYRLYSSDDVDRVGRMRELLGSGLSAAEAARQTLVEPAPPPADTEPAAADAKLGRALKAFDDAAAQAAFDRLLADYSAAAVLEGVVLPLLRELGDGWERGEITVAQEHFAANLLRGRLLGLARGWDLGGGPRAVLACPPNERHDLGLVIFGIALREHGWRITFLGADTPPETVVDTVRRVAPAAVVLAVADPARLEGVERIAAELADLSATVWVGGSGAEPVAGARLLAGSPFEAAALVAR
jgi:MerR family transcriptional regulator, light-induced transcriptional regulator